MEAHGHGYHGEDAGGDDSGESGEEGYEQEAPEALTSCRLIFSCGGRRCLSWCGRGVHLYGHLTLVEGALRSVAGLELEIACDGEGLLRGGYDDLDEPGSSLEIVDVNAESLVELDVGLLRVPQPSGEGEGGALIGGE